MTSLRRPAAVLAATLAAALLAAPGPATADRADAGRATVNGKHVIAISVDGLNPRALNRLGRAGAPNLHRLIKDEGAGTLNARTQLEMTVTLPNHTSMVTGRRIKASKGGHGVTWNDDKVTKTVQQAAGHDVASVFTQVHEAGGTTAVYATKSKFWLFERSWPKAVDKNVIQVEKNGAVVKALRSDLATDPASFSFVHLGKPDQVGHHSGWMSAKYLKAVAKMDALVGSIMDQVSSTPALRDNTVIVLTSDHGGIPGTKNHAIKTNREDYRVAFAFWGAGVAQKDLYALNPDRAKPGRSRPGFGASPQPIRNGEVANASLDILGVGPVPDSLWNVEQDLDWK
ncbi:alkaline phosphatase family protein [Nocardioides nitrophenolicus]|uniref:alkaline phosphatase family protein n=1 Tax=Nocardioides nitrophenolicus TaxID=60489 RepID=UPI00195B76B1|nr:alkaline phosphatase family protein [Nocardioides nitrophenolicus]MBM7515950.1 putative AlkP superfamily pyrophosphatase or phosphodiesterase [Nocardioides nitrophenolicus]